MDKIALMKIINHCLLFITVTILLSGLPSRKLHAQSVTWLVTKKWQTEPGIRTPESVLWDAGKHLFYVSDIKGDGSARDGNGFISTISPSGKTLNLHWVDGLDAPKGMGMQGNTLYAADLDQLVVIDIPSRKITKKITLPGASFLNDIATDDHGNVYISDSKRGCVYRYADGKASIYIEDPLIKGANGLLVWRGRLWIQSSRGLCQYRSEDHSLTLFSAAVKSCDGLTVVDDSTLAVSRWQGEVYLEKMDGSAQKIIDLSAAHQNTADLFYLASAQLLVIPTFNGNLVMGYHLHRR